MGDGGNESVAVTAGIWGFLVLFFLALACWLLFRSLNKHLRKVQWQDEKEHPDHPLRRRIPLARDPQSAPPSRSAPEPSSGTDGRLRPDAGQGVVTGDEVTGGVADDSARREPDEEQHPHP